MIYGPYPYGCNPAVADYELCSADLCANEEPTEEMIQCEFCGRSFCSEHGSEVIDEFRRNVCRQVNCLRDYVRELELGQGGPSLMARIGIDLERLLREATPGQLKVIEASLRCLAEDAKARREVVHA